MKNSLKKNTFLMLLFTSLCSGAEQLSDSGSDYTVDGETAEEKLLRHLAGHESYEEHLLRHLAIDDHYHEDEYGPVVPALRLQEPNGIKKAALQNIILNQEIDPEYLKLERHRLDFFFLSRGKKEDLCGLKPTEEIDVALPFWYQALQSKGWIPLLQLLTRDPEILNNSCHGDTFWELFAQAQPPLEVVARVQTIPHKSFLHRSCFLEHLNALGSLHPRTPPTTKQLFMGLCHETAVHCDRIAQYQERVSKLCAAELAANTYDPALERPNFNPREHLREILLYLWKRNGHHGFERYFHLVSMYDVDSEELIRLMEEGFRQILVREQSCTGIPFHFITAALKIFPPEDFINRFIFLQRCEEMLKTSYLGNPQILPVITMLKAKNSARDIK